MWFTPCMVTWYFDNREKCIFSLHKNSSIF
ncbi:hypothetical protein PITC_065250 [Penicillium italicum]|uniref:Uncharacterized protein n=1 Tax=Penicillium italicum TaxID=40296 RepID=A0A0A2KNN5_PENIT|nr:hypothetical protein PITC_065250 [Penicillium italicum]